MSKRIIDLTFPVHEGMTTFPAPWHPVVEITILGRHGIENRETRKIVLGTHTGTHCDAPRHFVPEGLTVDQLPLDILIGPAYVVDLSSARPNQEISVADLEGLLGDIRPERLIMRFDWSVHWGNMRYYSGHPFISEPAAHWLIKNGVKLLAMDTPMPDNPANGKGSENDSPVHKIMLRHGVILVEYLCNLQEIKKREVELIVLPLKILQGDGSPVRCVAVES